MNTTMAFVNDKAADLMKTLNINNAQKYGGFS